MKKLLLIFSLLFAAKSFAQYPLVQGLGNDSTLIKVGQNYKGGIKGGLINMSVADTTAANLLRIKAYPGAQIYTDDGSVWIRNITATGWSLLGGGVSPSGSFWAIGGNLFPVTVPSRNIGTLAPYGGAIGLMTNSVVHAIVPDAGFTLSNDTTNTKVFTWNPTSKEWGYANWNNGGGASGGGGIGSFEDSVANVRDYGAVGDGSTEDSTAFKNALATGRDVYVPKGVYKITAINLSPVAGQTIFGDGENTRIITAQTSGAIFKVVNPNVKFMNLAFEGSGKTSSIPWWTNPDYQTGIWVVIQSTTITNCTFRRFNGRGVYVFHPSATYILNNTILNSRFFSNTVGIESDYGADYLLIANNSLDSNYAAMIEGGNANVYYSGNQATQGTYGYYSRGGATHGSIIGGSFNHNTTGLYIPSGQQGITITDTKFWYSDIVLGASDTVSRVSFVNCVVEGSNVTLTKAKNNTWNGGYIFGGSANNITGTGLTFNNVITAPAGVNEWYGKITSGDSSLTTKNGLTVGRGVLLSGIPTFADTTNYKPLTVNAAGTVYRATYWPGGGGSGIAVGSTAITGGTDTRVGFNDGGVYGEDAGLTFTKASNRLNVDAIGTTGGLGYLTFDANGGSGNPDLMVDAGSLTLNLYNTWQFGWGVPLSSAIDVGLKRNAAAEVKITNGGSGTGDLVLRSSTFSGRNREGQGADVASANNLSLGTDGNTFEITGTTQINLIANTNWQNGSVIRLVFTSTPTVTNNAGTSGSNINILLSGGANFSATANDILTLMLCEVGGTQNWIEVSRSVN